MVVPPHDVAPEFYQDWGDAREYGVGDLGEGECAGEVVTPAEFQLTAASAKCSRRSCSSSAERSTRLSRPRMSRCRTAALALLKQRNIGFPEDAESVMDRFTKHFYDTQLFFDPFVGGKFAQYYFQAHERRERAAQLRAGAPARRGSPGLPRSVP